MMPPAIDDATFAALRDTTGDEFVRELVDTFLAEAPGMFDDLREGLAARGRRPLPPRRALAEVERQHVRRAGAGRARARPRNDRAAEVRRRGDGALAPIEAEYARVAAALRAWRDE